MCALFEAGSSGVWEGVLCSFVNPPFFFSFPPCFSQTSQPAGALAVAGMKKYVERHGIEGKNFVCITSGANMDFDRMR